MIAGTGFRLVDIEEVWPRWAARAERSRAGAEHLEWVRRQCARGIALCLECDDGMAVITLSADGAGMRVLLAVGKPGAMKRREADLLEVARAIGATEVTFRTDRPAWRRAAGPAWAADDDRFRRAA